MHTASAGLVRLITLVYTFHSVLKRLPTVLLLVNLLDPKAFHP